MTTTYLITGANRGIGYEFVNQLSANKDNFIVGSARDPAKATALQELAEKRGNIKIVQFKGLGTDSEEDRQDVASFAKQVSEFVIDVALINHGISEPACYASPTATETEWIFRHFKVNVISAFQAAKAVLPSMEKSNIKKVVFTSSTGGSMGGFIPGFGLTSYGISKAGLNFLMVALHDELHPKGYKVASFHPGLVASDMGNKAIAALGATPEMLAASNVPLLSPEESVTLSLKNVIEPLSDETSGGFFGYDGQRIPF